ncbi:MAG: hypothetical protein H6735_15280 [Alphaproteobacteria bacterium]|nr:hypothetical protein [Alphaproteobacteria bacterium]
MSDRHRSQHVPALVVVALGMLLVSSLAALAVWVVMRRRRTIGVLPQSDTVVHLREPAEA